jgi:hypothetical protein
VGDRYGTQYYIILEMQKSNCHMRFVCLDYQLLTNVTFNQYLQPATSQPNKLMVLEQNAAYANMLARCLN